MANDLTQRLAKALKRRMKRCHNRARCGHTFLCANASRITWKCPACRRDLKLVAEASKLTGVRDV